MVMLGKVLRMHHRDKKSVREIAKAASLSRNTVRKWLRQGSVQAPKYSKAAIPTKLAPYVEQLKQMLIVDAHRQKKERRTIRALHSELAKMGYSGGYTRLTDFVRIWRIEQGLPGVRGAFVPLAFALGEAFQFDWSEEGLLIGGIYRRLQVAHMKLCASRAFWLTAYPSQGHEMLFDAHTRSFAALGSVPRRGIYDNMRTAVDKVGRGKTRVVNARFANMCAHYLFDADFCNVASGWEKGGVEKNVQDSRRRVWITHHCHIVETGNDSYRVTQATASTKKRIRARESERKGAKMGDAPQPSQKKGVAASVIHSQLQRNRLPSLGQISIGTDTVLVYCA
jgi:transposase